MNREAIVAVALALVGVIAVALAAATLTATVSPGSGGFGTNASDREGSGLFPAAEDPPAGESVSLPIPPWVLSLLTALAAAAAVWVLLADRENALRVVASVTVALAVALVLGAILQELLTSGGTFAGAPSGPLPGDQSGGLSAGDDEPAPPSPLLLLLVGALVLGAVGVLVGASRRTGGRERTPSVTPDDDGTAAAVGRAAGRAANRIERDDAADNEVYRAWREMTEPLDVADPETSTPREFAEAAVAAGLAREDVDELTDLFERVRYGGEPATEAAERRAVQTLRRIEATYAEGGDA